ncbi:hypothetical protein O6H91_Y210000 [Diphasiastrum complanatum]|nr:hypothetical protein O6H91_Y210000 [Diphasiastrum complanatum]
MEIDIQKAELEQFNRSSPEWEIEMESRFEEVFERILQEAALKNPPLPEKVRAYVYNLYVASPVVGQKYKFTRHKRASRWNENALTVLGRGPDKQQLLMSKVENYLQGTKQYADHIVDEVIRYTEESVADESKKRQQSIHEIVKEELTHKLEAIQEKWDEHHNVAKRLNSQRERLRLLFQNCANRVVETKMLSVEVGNLLSTKMLED